MQTETYTLMDVFTRSELMSRYAIIILGANGTTGYGKSVTATALACHYATAYAESHGLPRDSAKVVITNTLDAARDIKWQPGHVWLIDEFLPADKESNVYCTESGLKKLFDPSVPVSMRARANDLCICEGVPRIITANAGSLEEWLGPGIECSAPLRRKSIVFVVSSPLVSKSWVDGLKDAAATNVSASGISDVMRARMASALS